MAARFWVPLPVTGAISGTGGIVRLTVPSTTGISNGHTKTVRGVVGTTEANGTTTVNVIDATHIELVGVNFVNTYTSGGFVDGRWDTTNSNNWVSGTGATNYGQTIPGSGDSATFDLNSGGGTIVINANHTIQNFTTSAFTGTLDWATNNNDFTMNGAGGANWTDAGSGTHTINMGSGTWFFTGITGSVLISLSGAGLTLNGSASTVSINFSTSGSFRLNGKTFGAWSFPSGGFWSFEASNGTIGSLTAAPGTSLWIVSGFTITISTAPTLAGTRAAPIILGTYTTAAAAGGTFSVPSGAVTLAWGILHKTQAAGGATFHATNTLSYGATTGWIVDSGPSAGGAAGVIGG